MLSTPPVIPSDMSTIPTSDGSSLVYKTTISLLNNNTANASCTVEVDSTNYNIPQTHSDGKLYLYLSAGSHEISVNSGGIAYSGTVNIETNDNNAVTLAYPNTAPVASNSSITAIPGVAKTGTVTATDADAGDTLTYSKVAEPTHGTLDFNINGSYTYTPTVGYSGFDSFTFKANDGIADSNVATVSITVSLPNTAPVANDSNITAIAGVAKTGTVTATDADAGDTLTYSKVAEPSHGTFDFNINGSYTYTPTVGYSGFDSFTFKANDGKADSNVATVSISASLPNTAPVASNSSITYNSNGATSGTVPTDSNTYTSGANVPLAGNTGNLTKTGYTFGGWALSADGKAETSYIMGTTPVTFYAVWTLSNQGISVSGNTDSGSLNTPAVMPFPANSNGTGSIVNQVKKAKDGEFVVVNMNGTTTLKSEWLEEMAGKDVDIVLDMGNGVKWTINGKSITGKDFSDIDLAVKKGTKTIPVDVINNIIGEKNVIQFTVTHSGEFGFTATVSMDLGKDNEGLYANLYYYNEETEELEFIDVCKIGANGSAAWDLVHTSTYAVIIDKVSLATENVEAGAGVDVNESLVASNVTDSKNNSIVFVVLVLISVVLFTVRLKKHTN